MNKFSAECLAKREQHRLPEHWSDEAKDAMVNETISILLSCSSAEIVRERMEASYLKHEPQG